MHDCLTVHNVRERVSVVLQNVENEFTGEPEKQQYETFKAHLMEQMSLLPAENKDLSESLQIFTRFGCFYFMDVSASLRFASKTITFQELQIAHEKGRHARKSEETKNCGEIEKMNLTKYREKDPAEGKSKFAMMCQFV